MIARPDYFQGQYLGAADFLAEQSYHREMRRRHNLGPHTWGIVAGLELVERPGEGGAVDCFVAPGVAVDGFGREIVVTEPYQLEPGLFAGLGGTRDREVWIAYREEPARPPTGGYAPCADGDSFTRAVETFRIVVEPAPPTRGAVLVGGREARPAPAEPALPPDESVPHQDLPEDDDPRARWLVRLGSVIWDASEGRVAATPDALRGEGRRHVGAIAAELAAPAAELVVRDRSLPLPLTAGDDGVRARVEGSLSVRRALRLHDDALLDGGALELRDAGGGTSGARLAIERDDDGGGGGADLELAIGGGEDGRNRLVVGPRVSGSLVERFSVADDGAVRARGRLRVGGPLTVDERPGDRIVLGGPAGDARGSVGVESGTVYVAARGGLRWYVGGEPDGGASDAMELTGTGLTVAGTVNGRDLGADGAKLDGLPEGASQVAMRSGTAGDGDHIDPPPGFSVAQCAITIAIERFDPPTFDVNEFGVASRFRIECRAQAEPGGWRAHVGWFQAGHGGSTGWIRDASVRAHYVVIGVR